MLPQDQARSAVGTPQKAWECPKGRDGLTEEATLESSLERSVGFNQAAQSEPAAWTLHLPLPNPCPCSVPTPSLEGQRRSESGLES